jgi:hypothetical protein
MVPLPTPGEPRRYSSPPGTNHLRQAAETPYAGATKSEHTGRCGGLALTEKSQKRAMGDVADGY